MFTIQVEIFAAKGQTVLIIILNNRKKGETWSILIYKA